MSNGKILLTKFGKNITDAVKNPIVLRGFIQHIEKFIDKNSSIMFEQGPSKHLLFANSDKDAVYEFTKIDPAEVKNTLPSIKNINPSWELLNDPFIILMTFIIRELEVQKKIRERDLVIMYFALKAYSARQKKSFPYEPNLQIMAYTINNLNDKFKYKALKNNYAVIKDIAFISHQTYTNLLVKGEDTMLNTYYPQIHSRISRLMNTIASEYYKTRDKKKYLNTVTTFDSELGGVLDHENSSALIASLAESTTSFFISNSINMQLVRNVSERNDIPYVSVYQTLKEMRKTESPDKIQEMLVAVVEIIYEADNAILARVCSKDFAITAIKQLSVSNSSSKPLIYLKNELERLLNEYCSKYAATQRPATKMAYRNALYTYLVYILISNKCG
jgi:hypothetical protein